MKNLQLEKASIVELIDLYIDSAIIHGKSNLTGEFKVNRKAHDVIASVYRELRRRGVESQSALLRLMDHEDASVRSWAASHALEFAPNQGAPVLEQIAKSGGIIAFNAEMTLAEWRNGNLEFP